MTTLACLEDTDSEDTSPPRPSAAPLRSQDVLEAGEVLAGNFEIKKLLGSGGMGQVWEAHDRALNRVVAIKVSWPHIDGEPLR